MSRALPEEWFVTDASTNAALAWLVTAWLAAVAVLDVLTVQLVTAAIAVTAVAVAVVPALVHRSWRSTVPWPLLLLASLPLVAPTLLPGTLQLLWSVSLAALSLLVVVALQLTTTVRMTPGFAVFFVVVATMGVVGLWALGAAAAATAFGTPFVETNRELMYVFGWAAIGGVVAGLVFRWYFRRRLAADDRAAGEGEPA